MVGCYEVSTNDSTVWWGVMRLARTIVRCGGGVMRLARTIVRCGVVL